MNVVRATDSREITVWQFHLWSVRTIPTAPPYGRPLMPKGFEHHIGYARRSPTLRCLPFLSSIFPGRRRIRVRPKSAVLFSGLALSVGEFARLVVPHLAPARRPATHMPPLSFNQSRGARAIRARLVVRSKFAADTVSFESRIAVPCCISKIRRLQ